MAEMRRAVDLGGSLLLGYRGSQTGRFRGDFEINGRAMDAIDLRY
jgi:hypothetical protein